MAGKLVLHNTFTGNTTLDLSKIKKGTYLLKIITEEGISSKKVIVEYHPRPYITNSTSRNQSRNYIN